PQVLVAAEQERLVFLDRAADVSAVLIAFEGRPFVVEEVPRIQFIVAQEFEAASVDLIGPRFRDQIDGRAAVLAKDSRKRLRLNLEFRYSVRRRLNGEASGKHVLRVHAVNQDIIPGAAQAVRSVRVLTEGRAKDVRRKTAAVRHGAGHQQRQSAKTPYVQRELRDLSGGDGRAHGSRGGFYQWSSSRHFHRRCDGPHPKLHIHQSLLKDVKLDARLDRLLKSGMFNG